MEVAVALSPASVGPTRLNLRASLRDAALDAPQARLCSGQPRGSEAATETADPCLTNRCPVPPTPLPPPPLLRPPLSRPIPPEPPQESFPSSSYRREVLIRDERWRTLHSPSPLKQQHERPG